MDNQEKAFPEMQRVSEFGYASVGGLTKRELFAAMAMQGMISGSQGLKITVEQFAAQSVKLADALIAELSKTKEGE